MQRVIIVEIYYLDQIQHMCNEMIDVVGCV